MELVIVVRGMNGEIIIVTPTNSDIVNNHLLLVERNLSTDFSIEVMTFDSFNTEMREQERTDT